MMRSPIPLLAGALLVLAGMAFAQDEQDQATLPAEDVVLAAEPFPVVGWPDGDVEAGQRAFIDLKCYSCHAVPSIPELAKLHQGKGPGPDFVRREEIRPRLVLLRQIVAPGADEDVRVSHMGNFADVMTVRQLTDLIAFVEHVERK